MALSYINNKEIKFGSSKPLNGVYTPGSPTREYEPLDSLGIYLNSGIPLSYGVENGRYMSMSDEFVATSQGNSYSFNQFFAAQMMLGFKLHDRFIACDTEHKIIGTEPLLHKAYLAEITEKTLDYFKIKIYEEKTRTFCIRMSSSEVPTSYVDLTNSFDENGLNLTQTDRQSFLSYYRFYPLTARDPSSRNEETLGVDYYLLPSAESLKELSGDILSKFNAFISSDGSILTSLGNTAFAYAGDIDYVPNYRGETSEAAVSAAESARVILGQVEEMHADINQILPEMEENLELTKQYRDEAMSTEIGTVREDLNQLKGDLNRLYDGYKSYDLTFTDGDLDSDGIEIPSTVYQRTDYIKCSDVAGYRFVFNGTQRLWVNLFNEDKTKYTPAVAPQTEDFTFNFGGYYVRFVTFKASNHVYAIKSTDIADDVATIKINNNLYRAEMPLKIGNPVVPSQTMRFGCKLPYGVKAVIVEPKNDNYQFYCEGYTTEGYSTRVYDKGWYYSKTELRFEQDYYYVIGIQRKDTATIAPSEMSNVKVYVMLDIDKKIDWLEYFVNKTYENIEIKLGSPLAPTQTTRIGCVVPDKPKSIWVKTTDKYQYYIGGYTDKKHTNAAYDSGWKYESERFIIENPDLYYVVVIQLKTLEVCTSEDIANNGVMVSRELNDAFAPHDVLAGGIDDIPDYYFADNYLPNKVDTINTEIRKCAAHGDAFMFISDEHWYWNAKNSPKLLKYIRKNTTINKLFSGGDRYDGYNIEATNGFLEAMQDGRFYPVVGNHDFFYKATNSDAYACGFMHLSDDANVHWGDSDHCYYYVDNNVQKIRYIVLQAFEPKLDGTQYSDVTITYTPEQVSWFTNTALNVPNNWEIVIFTHMLLLPNDNDKSLTVPEASWSSWASGYYEIYNAIKNYTGTIAAVVVGHTHWDADTTITRPDGTKIPYVIVTTDRCAPQYDTHQIGRAFDTITEQAFDVVVIDKTERKIQFIRIGYCDTVSGSKVEKRVFSY